MLAAGGLNAATAHVIQGYILFQTSLLDKVLPPRRLPEPCNLRCLTWYQAIFFNMVDIASIVALVIAVVALIIAAAQLTQQVLATAYVLRKCDRIVTGGLIAGGKRKWHWRQCRFTVRYQSLIMTLPESIYSSLGITSTVQRGQDYQGYPRVRSTVRAAARKILATAQQSDNRHVSEQACWVSLVQDLVASDCLGEDSLYTREESGDRIPDDMTVAPTKVDALTVLLTCVAMGMQVSKYSPTAGEVFLAGPVGSISSSLHPVLGGLVHYSAFINELPPTNAALLCNGRALLTQGGVWANAVFGRFRIRSLRNEFFQLSSPRKRYEAVLSENGWPKDSLSDTIGGAACFMAFAQVDVCKSGAPSPMRPWCAHFAELIVAVHLGDVFLRHREDDSSWELSSVFLAARDVYLENWGCSSRYLGWHPLHLKFEHRDKSQRGLESSEDRRWMHMNFLQLPSLVLEWSYPSLSSIESPGDFAHIDPSTYVKTPDAWEVILRADQCMNTIMAQVPYIAVIADRSTARAISNLAETGPPSWRTEAYKKEYPEWPRRIPEACERELGDLPTYIDEETRAGLSEWLPRYTELSILRAAYFTIMMRAAHDIGPGLCEDSRIDTALLYMA